MKTLNLGLNNELLKPLKNLKEEQLKILEGI